LKLFNHAIYELQQHLLHRLIKQYNGIVINGIHKKQGYEKQYNDFVIHLQSFNILQYG
jgi:hypothetical protein